MLLRTCEEFSMLMYLGAGFRGMIIGHFSGYLAHYGVHEAIFLHIGSLFLEHLLRYKCGVWNSRYLR